MSANRRSHRPLHRWLIPCLIAAVLLCCVVTPSFAQDLGQVADNISSNSNKMGKAIQVLGRLGGLGLIFTGLFTHYKAHKEQGQGHAKHSIAVAAWMIGAAAMYAGSVVKTTGNTLWGNGGGDSTTIQIDQ